MTTLALDPTGITTARAEEGMTRREQIAFVVFSTWTILGLFLDGWSHNHHRPESFFTPWHAVLYSGVGAGVAFSFLEARRQRRAGEGARLPDRLTVLGLVVFGAAAFGDFGWHQAFGIERNLAGLLSPTHLLLMTGGLLLVSAPFRNAWAAPGDRQLSWPEFLPVLVSATLGVALVSFFLMYLSPFRVDLGWRAMGDSPVGQQFQATVVASVLIANALFVGLFVLMSRRWQPPFGTFTASFTAVALMMSGLDTFHLLPLALTAVAGGLAADLLGGRRPAVVAAATSAGLWITYFAVLELHYHLGWQIHLWAGTVFLAVLSGVGLTVIAFPPALPASAGAQAADASAARRF